MQDDDEEIKEDEGPSPGTVLQGFGAGFIFIGFLVFIGIGPGSPNATDGARVAAVGVNYIGALILAFIGIVGIIVGTYLKNDD